MAWTSASWLNATVPPAVPVVALPLGSADCGLEVASREPLVDERADCIGDGVVVAEKVGVLVAGELDAARGLTVRAGRPSCHVFDARRPLRGVTA